MRVSVGAGTYVVAVSGGVDSMVLLDVLRQRPGLKLIVAHFDHGIRPDSHLDRQHVQTIARSHRLPFVHSLGNLGPKTSEATAREARYGFLEHVRRASDAKGIITAHHQDDFLETAIINFLRGSGRRGLTALKSTDNILRPLLEYDKADIKDYAESHRLSWREDPSNTDTKYLRNYVRHTLIPKLNTAQRAQLLILLEQLRNTNQELDEEVTSLLHAQPALDMLDRQWFIKLPHKVAQEVLLAWLRRHSAKNITRRTIERLIVAMKTAQKDRWLDVDKQYRILVKQRILALVRSER